jgi:hypothetical protein
VIRLRRGGLGCVLAAAGLTLGTWVLAPAGGADTAPIDFAFSGSAQTFTVPADGSVCAVALDLAGADGGQAGVNGNPGTGGTVQGTTTVAPGDVVSITVGGAGTATSGSTTVGGPGGFGGGGNGGDAAGVAGAGGGGATSVSVNGTLVLVAGGGGGGGGQTADGGAGGSSAGNGTDGQTNVGNGGGGATTTTNGSAGGGGGGGGGFFGGGGGGGAPTPSSGGGGGGGSGFADPARVSGVAAGTVTQDGSGNGAARLTGLTGSGTCLTATPVGPPAAPAPSVVATPRFTG